MTQTDYEQKKKECWDRCVEDVGIIGYIQKLTHDYAFDRAYALGKQEKDAEGEVMLSTSKNLAFKMYDIANDSYRENGNEWFLGYMKAMVDLFGDIFPPVKKTKETANCDKHFDNILKDSFRNERWLNIAAMAVPGILSNPQLLKIAIETYQGEIGSPDIYVAVAKTAKAQADALIAECESYEQKGGRQ